MPMNSLTKEPSPVLISLAGAYPGITAEQLMAPTPLPFPAVGKWNYHRLTEGGCPTGFVVLPGTELLYDCPNTVGVICSSSSLGAQLADGQEHELVALIDRDDEAVHDPGAMDSQKFYAFADPESTIHIRWLPEVPAGWRVVGKLIYTQLPFVPKPGGASGFAETSDDFEF
jgi:hypothetical protein